MVPVVIRTYTCERPTPLDRDGWQALRRAICGPLQERSGLRWVLRRGPNGRGIITAPTDRLRVSYLRPFAGPKLTDDDCRILGELIGRVAPCSPDGVAFDASYESRRAFAIRRAQGEVCREE